MSEAATGTASRRPRGRLVAVWAVLAVLAGGIAFIEYRDRSKPDDTMDEFVARAMVPYELAQIAVVEIMYRGTIHRFERDGAGTWFYHGKGVDPAAAAAHTHKADPVLAPAIEKALRGFSRTRMERQFPRGPLEKEYGTASPEMFIVYYGPKDLKPLGRVAVGLPAPDRISRYVLPDGSRFVVTIPNYQIVNLESLIKTANGEMTPAALDTVLSGGSPDAAKPAGDAAKQ